MICALAMSAALDVTYEVGMLVRGEINRPVATTVVAGGKALNMARVAHALGAEVHAIVALGGLTGERVREHLATDGVAMTVVRLVHETRTCFALVEAAGGATSTDVYERATAFDEVGWSAFAAAVRAVQRAEWVALSGSTPDGVPLGELAGLLRDARSRGSKIALDTSGAPLAALAPYADLIKLNLAEASDLVGINLRDAATACTMLREQCNADVVVTDGIRGGAALSPNGLVALAAPSAVGRFPAGSGDAFFGGLLCGLDYGLPLADALRGARDAAERNAQVPGQGILHAR